jgi:hypothetical protein
MSNMQYFSFPFQELSFSFLFFLFIYYYIISLLCFCAYRKTNYTKLPLLQVFRSHFPNCVNILGLEQSVYNGVISTFFFSRLIISFGWTSIIFTPVTHA